MTTLSGPSACADGTSTSFLPAMQSAAVLCWEQVLARSWQTCLAPDGLHALGCGNCRHILTLTACMAAGAVCRGFMHSPRLNGLQGAAASLKANGLRMPTVSSAARRNSVSCSNSKRSMVSTTLLGAQTTECMRDKQGQWILQHRSVHPARL